MEKEVILSGIRPTGKMHLGHIVGVIDTWLKFQNEEKNCFFEIADFHAMTDRIDYSRIQKNTIEMVTDWLALGIDPNKSTIFLQSLVPEHTELYTIFSLITPISWLERCPVYKDIVSNEKIKNPTHGLFGYPVLQAADIALYKATHIPVGEDQAPHLELTRKIIRRFNGLFGPIFPEPKTFLTENPKVLGTDGRKMSKSLGNFISPEENEEGLIKKVMTMITDPQKIRKNDVGNPNICSVYTLHNYYTPNRQQISVECSSGQRGCVDCKKQLGAQLYNYFSKFREARESYIVDNGRIRQIVYDSSIKARLVAKQTIKEVKEVMKINF